MEHAIQSKSTAKAVQKRSSFFAPAFVQPKLSIGAPNDIYEQEADSVADKVMRMGDGQQLQTKPSTVSVQRKCAHCEEEEKKLQRKPDGSIQRDTPDNDSSPVTGKQPYLHLSITMSASDPQNDIDSKINYGEANIQLIERGINMPADYTVDYSNLWKADYELSKGLRLGTMIKNLYGIGQRFDEKALRPVRGVVKKVPLVGGLLKSAIKFEAPKVEGNDWDKYAADKMALSALGNSLNRDNPAYNDVSGHTFTINIVDTNFDENNISKLFRKPASDNDDSVLQKKCSSCEKEEKINRKESVVNQPATTNQVEQTLQSTGHSMDQSTQSFMESRFGYDFSKVQIHNDALAHRSSEDINALAYTHGNHIVFGAGQYQPKTFSGKQLLAHELTHVVQQASEGNIQRKPLTEEEKKENLESDFLKDDARLQKAYDNAPLMAKDETSEGVKTLQRALKRLKYELPVTFKNGDADGIFGDETKKALQQFQSDNGLNNDGVAGRDTLKALDAKFNPSVVVEAVSFPDEHRQLVNNETDWSFAGTKYVDWSDSPYHIVFDAASARSIPISITAGKKVGAIAKVKFKGGIPGENFDISSMRSTGGTLISPAFSFNGSGEFQNNNNENTDFISLTAPNSVVNEVHFSTFSLNWQVIAGGNTNSLPSSDHKVFVTAAPVADIGAKNGTDFPNIPTFKRMRRATSVAKNQAIDDPGNIALVIIKKYPSYGACAIPYDPRWDSATFKCPQLQSIWEMSDFEKGRGHFQCITIANYTKAVLNALGISTASKVAVTPVVIWADPANPQKGEESLGHGYNTAHKNHQDWYLTLLDGNCGSNNYEACVKLEWKQSGVDVVQYYCGGVDNKEGGFKTPREILGEAFIALTYVKPMSKNDPETGFPRGIRMEDVAVYSATNDCKKEK